MNSVSDRLKSSTTVLFLCLLSFACKAPEGKVVSKPTSHTIQIRQMQFQPAELTVNKGDTVKFINYDMVTHDVTEETRKAWASGPLANGASWKMIVTDSNNYYCSIHAVMKGKIRLAE
jgi:plastocyanin